MTTNTHAPAHEAVLTDDQIDLIRIRAEKDSRRFGRTVDIPLRADLLLALLSKLRAPVADERAEWAEFNEWAWKKEGEAVGRMEGTAAVWAGWKERARRAALASAPVAGEAQSEAKYQRMFMAAGEALAAISERLGLDPNDGEPDVILSAIDELMGRANDAAPQASEAVPELGSAVVNDACWKFIEAMPHQLPGPILNDLKPALHAAISHVLAGRQQRAALSAQPGAQKGCNCATCRPHCVEMRMILCETCGDKRCPHAADHRNACAAHPDNKDGGANG